LDPPGKAADVAFAAAPAPLEATENSTGAAPGVEDPPRTDSEAAKTPVLLKSAENSTGVALAAEDPPGATREIHDMINDVHQSMCEDGRMDSPHCEKFRNTLDEMHGEIEEMHDDHKAMMAENATDGGPVATATSVEVEVEKVTEHKPVIQKHEYPYKTGPCASGTTAVALLFSGLLFA